MHQELRYFKIDTYAHTHEWLTERYLVFFASGNHNSSYKKPEAATYQCSQTLLFGEKVQITTAGRPSVSAYVRTL